ncbi:hypothetical protein CLV81_3602 [Flagellimonas meridianipacifica]|uniref:Uncharacterized protein n=1 Tax=Flagellimonas meridianipacifica TaxID=1080225 RepID=A0A2T0MCG9_9FLAO|nr:hypothetical protein CLV81_3602 [Allomuricauda pacifica]
MENEFRWKKEYTIVIVLNVLYISIFYLIMAFNN